MESLIADRPRGGFVFDNCIRYVYLCCFMRRRNEQLCKSTGLPVKMMKTGTTLAAVTFKVKRWSYTQILGWCCSWCGYSGNRRVYCCWQVLWKNPFYRGQHLVSSNCITTVVSCCGAGTAADTQMVTRMISSQIELHRLNTGRKPRVVTSLRLLKQHLFKYQVRFFCVHCWLV